MTTTMNDFAPEIVMASVVRELRGTTEDLEVIWDETAIPMVRCWVRSRSTKAEYVVHRSEVAVVDDLIDLIEENLLDGSLFKDSLVTTEVLDTIAKHCKLDDLKSYLVAESREGWILPDEGVFSHVGGIGECKTIEELKSKQAKVLEGWLKEPVKAVWNLQGGDLAAAASVLIEQCTFDTKDMCRAIMEVLGGWRSFGICPVIATTHEGFIIEAENEQGSDRLEELYEVAQTEGPKS
jgi:hypothetical protein